MKAIIYLFCLFFGFISHSAHLIKLNQILEQAKEEFNTPAISAAILDDETFVWQKALGFSNLETELLAQVTDVYRIGSVSKPIAALLMLTLVEEKKVNLTDTIGKFFPNYPSDKHNITIEQLLSHVSGIPHYQYELGEKENTKRFNNMEEALTIYDVHKRPLQFVPGTDFLYSTYGYNIIGAIIEKVLGQSYETAVNERIFNKAGMSNTHIDSHEKIIQNRVRHYRHGENNTFINAPYVDSSYKWSAGGIVSNVLDLLQLEYAIYNNELMSEKLRDLSETTITLKSGKNIECGLGWRVYQYKDHTIVGHSGTATGGRSYLLRLKDKPIAVALLVNVEKADRIKDYALKLLDAYLEN